MESRAYKEKALEMLSGKWLFSALYYLLGALLGSALAGTLICHPEYFLINNLITEEFVNSIPDSLSFIITGIFLYFQLLGVFFTAQLMVGGMVDLGVARYTLNLHDGHPTRIMTLFSQANNFTSACLLFYFRKILVLLQSLLLIVPGVIAHYKYALAQFIMCDYPDISARQALEESKDLMEGHKMELFKLELSFIGWHLLSIATLGIGYVFLRPYIISARVAFYRELCPAELLDR